MAQRPGAWAEPGGTVEGLRRGTEVRERARAGLVTGDRSEGSGAPAYRLAVAAHARKVSWSTVLVCGSQVKPL